VRGLLALRQEHAMAGLIDAERERAHQTRNWLHTVLLLAGIIGIAMLSAWLIWSWAGVVWALIAIGALMFFAPRVPPEAVMRMFKARRVDPRVGGEVTRVLAVIAERAGLASVPSLYIVPSTTLNAFATGNENRSAIAVTDGLVRRLTLRELAGVLAHEVSHIRNRDLFVMMLADAITRAAQVFSYIAVILAVFNILTLLGGGTQVSWLAIIVLYLAPTVSSLLQLGLSRTREYDADLDGAMLTGDPEGLASALRRLDQYQGAFWEDMMLPIPARRVPQPSLLRTHPATEERIARLFEVIRPEALARRGLEKSRPIVLLETPPGVIAGASPFELMPRRRWPGMWY
jgi:heat shock protein HtpX